MTTVPVRKLGALGIIKDVSPFDLPDNALSDGMNVRFDAGKVARAFVYRLVYGGTPALSGTVPVFCMGLTNPGSFDSLLYANNDGNLYTIANGAETKVTPATGWTSSINTSPFTGTVAAQCAYVNRNDQAPMVLVPGTGTFQMLPNWPAGYTAAALRTFGDYLVALNITKSGTNFPNLVKTSDAIVGSTYPDSWDYTDITKLATENPLTQTKTPLVDGGELGNVFALYTQDETYRMEQNGGPLIFDYVRCPFDDAGIINQNCWLEVDGFHFVFGYNDIYKHDGYQKISIIDQRNREKLFKELNVSQSKYFFVAHNRRTHEITFCHVSSSSNAKWPSTVGYCNYGAVYNYRTDAWSFVDLPNVTSASLANVNTVYTWDNVPSNLTWDNVGGSWDDQLDGFARHTVFTSVANTSYGLPASKLLVLDSADTGKVALALESTTLASAWVQRLGLALDTDGAPERAYKVMRAFLPRFAVYAPDVKINVQIGAHVVTGSTPSWDSAVSFDPTADYKVDSKQGGRFLAYMVTMPTANDFDFTGFDADVVITSRR